MLQTTSVVNAGCTGLGNEGSQQMKTRKISQWFSKWPLAYALLLYLEIYLVPLHTELVFT